MRRWLALLAVAVIVALAAGLYKAKTDAVKTAVRLDELRQEVKDERAAVRALRAEISHLESPARIEQLAKENLELQTGAQPRRPETAIDADLPPPEQK